MDAPKTTTEPQSAPSEADKFKALAARLFAVPKAEYDKEAAAVEAGKPIKADLSKPRGKH